MMQKKLLSGLLLFLLFLTGCGSRAIVPESIPETEISALYDTEADATVTVPEESEASEEEVGSLPETETEAPALAEAVLFGDEQFDRYLPLLAGKRVALLTNQTGIVGDAADGEHILDALLARGVDVRCVFSPEHGFRGSADAGETVDNAVDEKTGVPLLSLYGNGRTNAPEAADMERFDTVVIDLQDVGLRYFTYYISLLYMMDACAAYDKDVVLLDRPNPNGFYVDGPLLRDGFYSGVGKLPIPIVYGMTWGELAQMINGEGWLSAGADTCRLTVIPCVHYDHQTRYQLNHMPSPNLKDMHAIYLYASTCYFENTVVSVGRGTEYPFNIYGSPYLAGAAGYDATFTPVSMVGATDPPFLGELCYGVDLRDKPVEEIWEAQIDLSYLVNTYHAVKALHPDLSFFGQGSNGRYFLDLLTGSDQVRLMIEAGYSAEEIEASWQDEVEAFKEQRRPYLLYAE